MLVEDTNTDSASRWDDTIFKTYYNTKKSDTLAVSDLEGDSLTLKFMVYTCCQLHQAPLPRRIGS